MNKRRKIQIKKPISCLSRDFSATKRGTKLENPKKMEEKIREKNRTSTERIANCEFSVRSWGYMTARRTGITRFRVWEGSVWNYNINQFYNSQEKAFKLGFL